jgi:hypothetical protein
MEDEFDDERPLFEDTTLLELEYWFRPDEEPCLEWPGGLAGTCKCCPWSEKATSGIAKVVE